MKKILFVFFLFSCVNAHGQDNDYLNYYDANGRLLADTSFRITDVKNAPYILSGFNDGLTNLFIWSLVYSDRAFVNALQGVVVIELDLLPTGKNFPWTSDPNEPIYGVSHFKIVKGNYIGKFSELVQDTTFLNGREFYFNKQYKSKEPFKIYIPINFTCIEGVEGDHFKIEKYFENGMINVRYTLPPSIGIR